MKTLYKRDSLLSEWKLIPERLAFVNEDCNEESGCFQFVTCFLQLNSSAESEIERLQLYMPCFNNNQSENNIGKVFRRIKPDKSSGSLYQGTNKDCYSW